jgi:hypothetical protein
MVVRLARFCGVGSLALLMVGLLLEPAPAQGNRFTGPMLTREWRCSKCNGLLGQGNIRPTMTKCPHCGIRLINGGFQPANQPNPSQPKTSQPKTSQDVSKSIPAFNVVPFIVAGFAVMLGIVIRASR